MVAVSHRMKAGGLELISDVQLPHPKFASVKLTE